MIRNLKEAEAALAAYVPPTSYITRKDITLERMLPFMPLIGNPQERLRVIHVAGTSGKTSTASYIAALLTATGKKTGLAVSPHIDTITERIQINGHNISEADFCSELGIYLDLVQAADPDPRPSYFELLHAFTLWYMVRQGVFYAVIETGVGGLHDATNITLRADKVCVITDIGFDHMDLLGQTLPAIAGQKIGIAYEHNNVFMYQQAEEVMNVIEAWTTEHHAPLHLTTQSIEQQGQIMDAMPDYQQRNWLLAHYVYKYLSQRDHLQHLTSQALHQTQHLQVPGRMDVKKLRDKTLVMDGAHNSQKMKAFVSSFRRLYLDAKPSIMVSLKDGKDYQDIVPLLAPLTDRVITTTFRTSQDLPLISMDSEVLAQAFRSAGVAHVENIPDNQAAFQALVTAPEDVCVITGSFYLIGQIRNNEHLA